MLWKPTAVQILPNSKPNETTRAENCYFYQLIQSLTDAITLNRSSSQSEVNLFKIKKKNFISNNKLFSSQNVSYNKEIAMYFAKKIKSIMQINLHQ